MPNIVLSARGHAWAFAEELKGFLPQSLTVRDDFINWPAIYENGFWGFFQGEVAEFLAGYNFQKIIIKKPRWKTVLVEAATNYEAKHGDLTIDIEVR